MKQVIPFYKEIVFKTNIASIISISLEHEEKVFDGEVSGDFIVFGDYKIHNDTTEKELFKYRLPFTALIPNEVDKNSVVVDVKNFTYEQIESDVIRVNIDFIVQGDIIESLDNYEKVFDINEDTEKLRLDDELDKFLEIQDSLKNNSFLEDDEIELLRNDSDKQEMYFVESIEDDENFISDLVINEENQQNNEDINDNMEKRIEINNIENEVIDVIKKNSEVIKEKSIEENSIQEKNEYVIYHIHIVKENETIENIIKNYSTSLECLKEYNEISEVKVGDKIIIPEYGEE